MLVQRETQVHLEVLVYQVQMDLRDLQERMAIRVQEETLEMLVVGERQEIPELQDHLDRMEIRD